MTISMFQASVPVFSATLKNLAHVLSKGEAHAADKGIDPAELVTARLAADMLPLSAQVQIACDHAKGAAARLAGREILKLADGDKTFAELKTRIATVRDHLASYSPADIDGSEDRAVTLKIGPTEMQFTGQQYLLGFATANFYFHVVTAYDILRHKGVPLGKGDFFGRG